MNSSIHAVFNEHARVKDAIELLQTRGIKSQDLHIVGIDSDDFRVATSPVHVKRVSHLLLVMGATGFACGTLWGYLGTPALAHNLPSVFMSAVMGAFCGAMLGALAGAQAWGVLTVDGAPMTDAKIREGKVKEGVVAISIKGKHEADLESLTWNLLQIGATKVSVV